MIDKIKRSICSNLNLSEKWINNPIFIIKYKSHEDKFYDLPTEIESCDYNYEFELWVEYDAPWSPTKRSKWCSLEKTKVKAGDITHLNWSDPVIFITDKGKKYPWVYRI